MSEPQNLTLPMLERIDAKVDRLQTTLDDHTKRLLRLEQRHIERDGHSLRQDEEVTPDYLPEVRREADEVIVEGR